MGYSVDHRLLRLTGELLAECPGRFRYADVIRLIEGSLEDDALRPAEMAALLVASVAVRPRAEEAARQHFAKLADFARRDDAELEPWIASSIAAPLLQRAAAVIAGRGRRHTVTRQDVLALLNAAYQGGRGPAPGITRDEGLAFLIIRELFDGRMAADAQALVDEVCAHAREDGASLGASRPPSAGGGSTGSTRQCSACAGMGTVTCHSCGGYGYHTRSGSRPRPDGSVEYYQENIPCGCASGRVRCGRCGGAGRI